MESSTNGNYGLWRKISLALSLQNPSRSLQFLAKGSLEAAIRIGSQRLIWNWALRSHAIQTLWTDANRIAGPEFVRACILKWNSTLAFQVRKALPHISASLINLWELMHLIPANFFTYGNLYREIHSQVSITANCQYKTSFHLAVKAHKSQHSISNQVFHFMLYGLQPFEFQKMEIRWAAAHDFNTESLILKSCLP